MYSKYPFTLDIHGAVSQVSIPVTRGDTARRLYIALTDGGVPFRVDDGVRAVLTAEKADGTHLLNDCIIENGGTVIRYDFTEQTASAVGKVACQVKLYGLDGEVLAEPRFSIIVYEGYTSDDVISKDEKTAIDGIFAAEAEREAAERAREAAEVEREETARRAEEATKRINDSVRGDRVFIRYAEDENGRNYTDEWRKGLNYVGVYVGLYEPADASGYEWSLFSPGVYVGSGDMPDYADIQIDPNGHIDDNPSDTAELENRVSQIESDIGDIDTALGAIIEIQNSLMGGSV